MPELASHSTPILNPLPAALFAPPGASPVPLSPPPTMDQSGTQVVPPIIDPAAWEDFPVFRETFLMYFTEPPANAALRIFGRLFHELVLEYYHHWPSWPEGVTTTELRAAVADLRHLEGYLGGSGKGARGSRPHGSGIGTLATRSPAGSRTGPDRGRA